jgi:hypothetical protein
VKCTDYEVPHYEVFPTPLLPRPFKWLPYYAFIAVSLH